MKYIILIGLLLMSGCSNSFDSCMEYCFESKGLSFENRSCEIPKGDFICFKDYDIKDKQDCFEKCSYHKNSIK